MFKAILYQQWKWSRPALILAAVLTAVIPITMLRSQPIDASGQYHIPTLYYHIEAASRYYQSLAFMLGLLMAVAAWQPDQQGKHVYALSLPVPRWRYVLLRFAAGAALCAAIATAAGLFGALASALAPLPPILHSYAVGLSVRLWLGAMVTFSIVFAVGSSTPRTVVRVLSVLALVGGVELALVWFGVMDRSLVLGDLMDMVVSPRGPLAVFASKWMLIDV